MQEHMAVIRGTLVTQMNPTAPGRVKEQPAENGTQYDSVYIKDTNRKH